jgi:hypothetical protein
MIQHEVVDKSERYDFKEIFTHETEHLENEAKLAFSLVERWGMVAALPDGEDSSGRSKLRLMTVEELTERAFKTAESFFKYARDNGLMHGLGNLEDLKSSD